MEEKKKEIKIRLSEQEEKNAKIIAQMLGCTYNGKPSLSVLLRTIANGENAVIPKKNLNNP